MRRLEMSGKIDFGAVGISLAMSLAVILVLCIFLGRATPDLPMPIVSLGIGWTTALVLGIIYECVVAAKSQRHGLSVRPALSAAARKRRAAR